MDHESVQHIFDAGRTTVDVEARTVSVESDVSGSLAGSAMALVLDEGQHLVSLAQYEKIADRNAEKPRRRVGSATHFELSSFVQHVNRFRHEHSAVWADLECLRLTAVLNYHGPGPDVHNAAWGDHRSVYTCPVTDSWKEWTAQSGLMCRQVAFADFLEEHEIDILTEDGYPSALDMIEMARDLRVYTKGTFERKFDRRTGTSTLVNKTERGEGSTDIPASFLVAVQIFEGGARYTLEASMRFKLADGVPRLGFKLIRYMDRLREAFGEIRDQVAKETKLPVFAGRPEGVD